MDTKFVNVKQYATMKKCSRETIYNAAKRGEVDIDRQAGFPVIYLTGKNIKWNPGNVGRPKKGVLEIPKGIL